MSNLENISLNWFEKLTKNARNLSNKLFRFHILLRPKKFLPLQTRGFSRKNFTFRIFWGFGFENYRVGSNPPLASKGKAGSGWNLSKNRWVLSCFIFLLKIYSQFQKFKKSWLHTFSWWFPCFTHDFFPRSLEVGGLKALSWYFHKKIVKMIKKPPNLLLIFARFHEKFIEKSSKKFHNLIVQKHTWYNILCWVIFSLKYLINQLKLYFYSKNITVTLFQGV